MSSYLIELERQKQTMLEKQKDIEQKTLDSASKSLALLRESEQIAIVTTDYLAHQHEQLKNTDRRLDEINTNLVQTQKNLNGIQSVFHTFKNYMSGKAYRRSPNIQVSPSTGSKTGTSRLNDTLDNINNDETDNYYSHPTVWMQGLYEEMPIKPTADSQCVNQILYAKLDEISSHISSLKDLGLAMGEEIDEQNKLINKIHSKVDVADIKIGKQTRQMNKLLGK